MQSCDTKKISSSTLWAVSFKLLFSICQCSLEKWFLCKITPAPGSPSLFSISTGTWHVGIRLHGENFNHCSHSNSPDHFIWRKCQTASLMMRNRLSQLTAKFFSAVLWHLLRCTQDVSNSCWETLVSSVQLTFMKLEFRRCCHSFAGKQEMWWSQVQI